MLLIFSCPKTTSEPIRFLLDRLLYFFLFELCERPYLQAVPMSSPEEDVHDPLCLRGAGEGRTSTLCLHGLPPRPGLLGMQEETQGLVIHSDAVPRARHSQGT